MKKLEKCNNVSNTTSVKLDMDRLLYHNIPLKYVTKVGILNIIYNEPQKKRNFCDKPVNKETKKTRYADNYVHEKIDPKPQNMSKFRY